MASRRETGRCSVTGSVGMEGNRAPAAAARLRIRLGRRIGDMGDEVPGF